MWRRKPGPPMNLVNEPGPPERPRASSKQFNELYYSDSVVFKVEDEYFKVPKHEFMACGGVIREMLEQSIFGATPDQAMVLEGVDKASFESLLKIMYPRHDSVLQGTDSTLITPLTLSQSQWMGVLKLSVRWGMTKYRQYALQRLASNHNTLLPPLDRLQLGLELKDREWFMEGLTELCDPGSTHVLPAIDALAVPMGWEFAARILSVRVHSTQLLNNPAQSRNRTGSSKSRGGGESYAFTLQSIRCWGTSKTSCTGPKDSCLFEHKSYACPHCAEWSSAETQFSAKENAYYTRLGDVVCPNASCGKKIFRGISLKCRFCRAHQDSDSVVWVVTTKVDDTSKDLLRELVEETFKDDIRRIFG